MENETRTGLVLASDRRWALIEAGFVRAVIFWDGDTATYDPAPLIPVELEPANAVGPGWTFDGVLFAAPAPEPDPE